VPVACEHDIGPTTVVLTGWLTRDQPASGRRASAGPSMSSRERDARSSRYRLGSLALVPHVPKNGQYVAHVAATSRCPEPDTATAA
jgi:hypothetical protein